MHHDEYHGHGFNYNGDYSGDIHIELPEGIEIRKSFKELTVTALYDNLDEPYTQAARTFVAFAAYREAISRLEQMEPDDLLDIPWLRDILDNMTTN